MKSFLFILSFCLVPFVSALAQEVWTITGYVYSGEVAKDPVPDATITLKSTGKSTKSDDKGYFSIDSKVSQDTLIITEISHGQEQLPVSVQSPGPLVIQLQANTRVIEDVVINTGYQSLPKERLTGSFYKIDNDVFNQTVSTDVVSRLEGISSGLLFDKRDERETKIQIRGLNTLISESQPLIILDNFPYEGDINEINPNDVEDITILKDAAAASIWGARAGNGVIVISTKKGKFNNPFSVSFNSNTTITEKPNLNNIPFIPSSEYIELERYLYEQGFYNGMIGSPAWYPLTPVVELLADKDLPVSSLEEQLAQLRKYDVRDDFDKYLYRTGVKQQYSLSLNGGTEKVHYYFSTGYDRNRDNLVGNDYSRFTLKSNNTFRPHKKIQVQTDFLYTQTNSNNNNPGGTLNAYKVGQWSLYPYARFADDNGTPLSLDHLSSRRFTDTVGNGDLLDWKYYPLQELAESNNSSTRHNLVGNLGIRYNIIKGLDADVKYQYEKTFGDSRNYRNENTFYTRDLVNRYTNLSSTNPGLRNPVPIGGIMDITNSDLTAQSLRGQLNVDRQWGRKGQITAIAGFEMRDTRTKQYSSRTYGYDPDFLSFKSVDYMNYYPTYGNLFGSRRIPTGSGFKQFLYRYVSMYTNAAYTFKDRYTLSASARKDASNIFGVDANDRGTPLWSTGLAWDISKEKFFDLEKLTYLKLRATYGYSGNVNHEISALTIIQYAPVNYSLVNMDFAEIKNAPNPNLRWEKVNTLNLGIDFRAFNDRLNGSIEYYSKKSTDLLSFRDLDITTGAASVASNSANMKGAGIDVVLNGRIVDRAFKWYSTALFSHSTYKVTKILEDQSLDGYISNGSIIKPIIGYSPYEVVSYRWAGLDPVTGDPQGYVNGEISKDYSALRSAPFENQVIHGSGLPLFFGNLRNTFSYKGFSATFNIAYNFDYYIMRSAINYSSLLKSGTMHGDYMDRWKKPGDEKTTDVPSFAYPVNSSRDAYFQYSEANVVRGDHIRLKDIYFQYKIGKGVLRTINVDNVDVYVNLANLNILLWKANDKGVDPNYPNGLTQGIAASLGLKFNF